MYYCNDCNKKFEHLIQFSKNNKMFQLCPHCKSEDLKLLSSLSEEEKLKILRENKLERILDEKNNIITNLRLINTFPNIT